MVMLSKNFSLNEMLKSQTAERLGIDNSPDANASYWNKGDGIGSFDPNKIKLVYY